MSRKKKNQTFLNKRRSREQRSLIFELLENRVVLCNTWVGFLPTSWAITQPGPTSVAVTLTPGDDVFTAGPYVAPATGLTYLGIWNVNPVPVGTTPCWNSYSGSSWIGTPLATPVTAAALTSLDVTGLPGDDTIDAKALTLLNGFTAALVVTAHGNDGQDTIKGSEFNDKLWGDGDTDNIYGLLGDDHIYGGLPLG